MKKRVFYITILLLSLGLSLGLLSGCGQTGDLYLPDNAAPKQSEVSE